MFFYMHLNRIFICIRHLMNVCSSFCRPTRFGVAFMREPAGSVRTMARTNDKIQYKKLNWKQPRKRKEIKLWVSFGELDTQKCASRLQTKTRERAWNEIVDCVWARTLQTIGIVSTHPDDVFDTGQALVHYTSDLLHCSQPIFTFHSTLGHKFSSMHRFRTVSLSVGPLHSFSFFHSFFPSCSLYFSLTQLCHHQNSSKNVFWSNNSISRKKRESVKEKEKRTQNSKIKQTNK